MQDLATLIAAIEAAGYDWALGGSEGQYEALVEKRHAPPIEDVINFTLGGTTPYEALSAAAKKCGIF